MQALESELAAVETRNTAQLAAMEIKIQSILNKVQAAQYVLVKSNAECKCGDVGLGNKASVQECADATKAIGGSFFIFGKGNKAGKCWKEDTASAACSEGWETDEYDFYSMQGR